MRILLFAFAPEWMNLKFINGNVRKIPTGFVGKRILIRVSEKCMGLHGRRNVMWPYLPPDLGEKKITDVIQIHALLWNFLNEFQ